MYYVRDILLSKDLCVKLADLIMWQFISRILNSDSTAIKIVLNYVTVAKSDRQDTLVALQFIEIRDVFSV